MMLERLFDDRLFQETVDAAVYRMFGTQNAAPTGARYVRGFLDLSGSSNIMSADPHDRTTVYFHGVSERQMRQWYSRIRGRFHTQDSEGIACLLQEDMLPGVTHEIQHLAFSALSPGEQDAVSAEVRSRMPDTWKCWASHFASDLKATDELLAEARGLYELPYAEHTIGYTDGTPRSVEMISTLFPVMHAVAKKYAVRKGIPAPETMFRTESRFPGGLRTVRDYASGAGQVRHVLPSAKPFSQ